MVVKAMCCIIATQTHKWSSLEGKDLTASVPQDLEEGTLQPVKYSCLVCNSSNGNYFAIMAIVAKIN